MRFFSVFLAVLIALGLIFGIDFYFNGVLSTNGVNPFPEEYQNDFWLPWDEAIYKAYSEQAEKEEVTMEQLQSEGSSYIKSLETQINEAEKQNALSATAQIKMSPTEKEVIIFIALILTDESQKDDAAKVAEAVIQDSPAPLKGITVDKGISLYSGTQYLGSYIISEFVAPNS